LEDLVGRESVINAFWVKACYFDGFLPSTKPVDIGAIDVLAFGLHIGRRRSVAQSIGQLLEFVKEFLTCSCLSDIVAGNVGGFQGVFE